MMIGRTLNDRYEVIQFVGQGGMAKVYRGFDTVLNRDVAIKVLQEEFKDNEQFLKKFKREAQAAGKLSHPHIVNIYDTGNDNDVYYIVMEYVDGGTLKDYINARGRLSYREGINYALAIASALGQAHKNNIIHRDVKPQNILLTKQKRIPKVTDFGIARAITSSTMTMVDETMGSVHYLSPEQARGGYLDERSDLYSLGILLYEMVTGKLPFDSDSPVAVALMQIQEDIVPIRNLDPSAPEGLDTIIQNLTAKSPNDRYKNAAALIKDLKALREDFSVHIRKIGKDDVSPTEKIPVIRDEEVSVVPNRGSYENPEGDDKRRRDKDRNRRRRNRDRNKGKMPLKKKLMLGILGIIVVLGLVFAGSRIFAKEIKVPDVTGMTEEKAVQTLEAKGLKVGKTEQESSIEVAEGSVISQDPQKDTIIKSYKKVNLVISSGPADVKVPNVVGATQSVAEDTLAQELLKVKVVNKYNDQVPEGEVFNQEPAAGEEVKQGNTVTIYVSKGESKVVMEDLTGLSLSEAKEKITSLGLTVGEIKYEASSKFDKDFVMSTSPGEYAEVNKGSSVDLVVSKGKTSSKTVAIDLKEYSSQSGKKVKVEIIYVDSDGNTSSVYNGRVRDTDVIKVNFTGYGVGYYKVYINGAEQGNGGVVTF